MNKVYKCVFICFVALSTISAHGMFGRFSSYMAHACAASTQVINRFSVRSGATMAQLKNRFTSHAHTPVIKNRANLFSVLYGGGAATSIASWIQSTKNKQEQECAAKQKVVAPRESTSSVAVDVPQENSYLTPWFDACKKHYKELESKPWKEVSKKYIEALKQREAELEGELCSRFGLTAQAWLQFKNDCQQEFLASVQQEVASFNAQAGDQSFDARIMSAAKSACQKIGIDYNKITLVPTPASTQSTMFAMNQYLMVNQTLCLMPYFSDDQKREVSVARELQHILHDDTFDKYCIEKIHKLNSDKVDQGAYKTFAQKVSHFKEERADIMVALADPAYGQTGKNTFKDLSNPSWVLKKIAQSLGKDLSDPSPMTHPNSLYRYECVSKVHQEIMSVLEKQ